MHNAYTLMTARGHEVTYQQLSKECIKIIKLILDFTKIKSKFVILNMSAVASTKAANTSAVWKHLKL